MAGISLSYNFSRINSVTNIKINILNKHDKNHVLCNCLILNLLKKMIFICLYLIIVAAILLFNYSANRKKSNNG